LNASAETIRYAEVIGDPVAHSLSPAIHGHWLETLGEEGRFLATRVARSGLGAHLQTRRRDPLWRGCSVTAPHKQAILPLLDDLTQAARETGAVNCVFRRGEQLVGTNTDLDGVAHALAGVALASRKAVLIGAGGAARAALAYLKAQGPAEIVLLVRDPRRAEPLAGPGTHIAPLTTTPRAIAGAQLIVNASPLGMAGAPAMPAEILATLSTAPAATVMDMVYHPRETELLASARHIGLAAVDGLEMLLGQARQAFTLFFGAEPPSGAYQFPRAPLMRTPAG
jgi:shikimate dehydrogenase